MSSPPAGRESESDTQLKALGVRILQTKDLFKILNISRDADPKTIKKSYRKVNLLQACSQIPPGQIQVRQRGGDFQEDIRGL